MKNLLSILLIQTPLLFALAGGLTGCASKIKRTQWTDPVMRVMIDPYSIDAPSYVKIQYALHDTGKWTVVDRSEGLRAIKYEQEQLHRAHPDRYSDREKFAHWGKLFGVGGVVTAHKQCTRHYSFFGKKYQKCKLNLAIMSANTAEVLSASSVQTEVDGWTTEPEWTKAAQALTDKFPEYFENHETEQLEYYKDLSKEEAIRQKEIRQQEKLDRQWELQKKQVKQNDKPTIIYDLPEVKPVIQTPEKQPKKGGLIKPKKAEKKTKKQSSLPLKTIEDGLRIVEELKI